MSIRRPYGILIGLLAMMCMALVSACAVKPTAEPVAAGEARAWIDAPLEGSVLPLGEIQVIVHGSDPQGVGAIEFSINGEMVHTEPIADSVQHLQAMIYAWRPAASGRYEIGVRVQGVSGEWSQPAEADVLVLSEEELTATRTTPTPDATATPTMTVTPTATATITPTSTPAGTTFSEPQKSTDRFYYRFSDCPDKKPNEIYLEINASDPLGINHVELYYRLKDQTSGEITAWQSMVMADKGAGHYTALVDADLLPRMGAGAQLWMQYQFIANNQAGDIYRSEVYGDVEVRGCRD